MFKIRADAKYILTSVLPTILVIILVVIHLHYAYNYALRVNDYISDECWYVSSARNLIVTVFRGQPIYVSDDGLFGINILISDYANTYQVINEVLIISGGRVVKQDYRNIRLIYAEVKGLNTIQRLSEIPGVLDVIPGYRYPDSAGITTYLNTEHPPLVKYFIALSILLLGDKPVYWRLPSIIASCIILVLVYLVTRLAVGGAAGNYLGVVAVLLTSLDTLFKSLSVVAMLDIFVSLFTILTLYLMMRWKVYGALTTLGLAFISKYVGLFAAPILLYYMLRRTIPIKAIILVVSIPLFMLIISSTPLISTLGFQRWWYEAVENAVRWHLSVKTVAGPPTSAPWEWLIGLNPFILHYEYVNGEWVADLIAKGNNAIYLIAVVLVVLILPMIRKLPDRGITSIYTWCIFLMYVLIWVIGSRTQYSFYMIQLTPLIYASLMVQLFWITFTENFKDLMRKWYALILSIVRWLLGKSSIKIYVGIEPAPNYSPH